MTCNDFSNLCAINPGANAYELGGRFINICPRGFTFSPWVTECHVTDLGGIIVHEMSHATTVYSPGTGDLARGYENSLKLSAGIALMNADNYAWFANGTFLALLLMHSLLMSCGRLHWLPSALSWGSAVSFSAVVLIIYGYLGRLRCSVLDICCRRVFVGVRCLPPNHLRGAVQTLGIYSVRRIRG